MGVICVDSGFEIHFAGAAGLDIKGTQILGHSNSEDETVEIITAVIQMYREQGYYLERIYKWAKRVGYDEVRAQIMTMRNKETPTSSALWNLRRWLRLTHGKKEFPAYIKTNSHILHRYKLK